MTGKRFILGLIITSLLIFSCGDKTLYDSSIPLDSDWESDRYLLFNNIPAVQGAEYFIEVSHREDYGFENIYLNAILVANSDTIENRIFSIPLMTPDGIWIGQRNKGNYLVRHQLPEISFDEYSSIDMNISQYSRESTLKGVEEITLSVIERPSH